MDTVVCIIHNIYILESEYHLHYLNECGIRLMNVSFKDYLWLQRCAVSMTMGFMFYIFLYSMSHKYVLLGVYLIKDLEASDFVFKSTSPLYIRMKYRRKEILQLK